MAALTLPTKTTRSVSTPMQARVMLIGHPKVGKTTTAAEWAPEKTLIIDTHNGTKLLAGDHYVQHVSTYDDFKATVDLLIKGGHQFETVVIDTIDDVYKFADAHAAGKHNKVAAGLVEFGKGTSEAEGVFRRDVGALLQTRLGVWFIGHAETEQSKDELRYVPRLDKRVRTFVTGNVDYVWFAERAGTQYQIVTAPSGKFEAGSRTPMPDPSPLDARAIWQSMNKGLKQLNADGGGSDAEPEPAAPADEPEPVAA